MFRITLTLLLGLAVSAQAACGVDERAKLAPADKTVEQIAQTARKSVVVITFAGRDGRRQGLGTGFIVAADGLIATNLHVIGEARPISVELADGKKYEVTSIHASDRSLDLALLRIKARALSPLELGDSAALKDGQPVVALGNPLGLTNSVVAGVVSGKREIEGHPMIQLAIPIEQGNSGGPLLDMQGRVQGLLTMKSLVTSNLGFAVPINTLKPLLQKPNPIPMERWLTIGTLDPSEWTTVFGARWKQRAGLIQVEGQGSGFGGRALCLSQGPVPALPFEVAVSVRLDDEAGAAGLVFHADGGDEHYGFYPSAGRLRLTRFDGPDVYSWKILREEPSSFYRLGEWNTLKVRLEKDKIRCFVNGHLVIESADTGRTSGKVGLAKFRQTRAEFKHFQAAQQIKEPTSSPELAQRLTKTLARLSSSEPLRPELAEAFLPDAAASLPVLRERARQLEQQASQLRDLAELVHQRSVQAELIKTLERKEDDIDLLHAALLLAKLDNDEVETEVYSREVERMVRELKAGLPKDADDKARLSALNKFLFTERGFHGSRTDYYNKSNSYLNEVLDDREGLPITLSVLYMEIARRLGVTLVGIGLPGHFVVKHVPSKGTSQFIDVYEAGQVLTDKEVQERVKAYTGAPASDSQLAPVTKKAILVRMLHNLLGLTQGDRDLKGALRYLDTIVAIDSTSTDERLMRAGLRYQGGYRKGALEDIDWLLEHRPANIKEERLRELRRTVAGSD
jgi:regulator of sirC expression with transglutaminase-like and TPR domain